MAKGTIAKESVVLKIREAFGADFIGEVDKKVYLWAEENGEKVQIALSLSCPKNPIGQSFNEENATFNSVDDNKSNEITNEEKENIANLMARLNL